VREEEGEEKREVRFVGGMLSTRVSKKKVATQAEWLEANISILSTCPTDKMRSEYLGYMKRATEILKQYSFSDFRSFDEGYRRMRYEDRAPWSEQYPELWLKLMKGTGSRSGERKGREQSRGRETSKPCWYFNKAAGCKKGANCDFSHRCSGCGENHSRVACPKGKDK